MLDGKLEPSTLLKFRDQYQTTAGKRHIQAVEHCERHFRKRHPTEHLLAKIILNLLVCCLQEDPLSRSTAKGLLADLQRGLALQETYRLPQAISNPDKLMSLDDPPFFNLSNHYYELLETLTVSRQVFKNLQGLVMSWPINDTRATSRLQFRLNAELQLALCYASGFGVETDSQEASKHITNVARAGLIEARVLFSRLHAALGITSMEISKQELVTWLEDAVVTGSVTAIEELQQLRAELKIESPCSFPVDLRPRHGISGQSLEDSPLHRAVFTGDAHEVVRLIRSGQDVNTAGLCGQTVLHYTAFLPQSQALLIADTLLKAGADIFAPTSDLITFSEYGFILNDIQSGMSPLDLVLSRDHIALWRLILSFVPVDDPRFWSSNNVLAVVARYQSLHCLNYLLEHPVMKLIPKQSINTFDNHNLSPMYYACRPDFFDRLNRFQSTTDCYWNSERKIIPLLAKELQIINLLRATGIMPNIHGKNVFNAIHLLASYGDASLLDHLLFNREWSALKDELCRSGWTPLREAIVRGRRDAFNVLLKHNVQLKNVWTPIPRTKKNTHALHVCCHYPGSEAIAFAESILNKEPKCLNVQDSFSETPLHEAARYGHIRLIKFYDKRNASLLATNHSKLTPLGVAIENRMNVSIWELCRLHRRRSLPTVSMIHNLYRLNRSSIIYPIEQLITPSSNLFFGLDRHQHKTHFGCSDYPFSAASFRLLQKFLTDHPPRVKLGVNFLHAILYTPLEQSGLFGAIKLGNLDAFRAIFDNLETKVGVSSTQLRIPLLYALVQLCLAKEHIASEEERTSVIEFISSKYVMKFEETKRRRQTQALLSIFWKIYYALYGDLEHRQFIRVKEWRQNVRFYRFFVPTPECYQWHRIRISPAVLNQLLVIFLQIPGIVALLNIKRALISQKNVFSPTLAVVGILMVSQHPCEMYCVIIC